MHNGLDLMANGGLLGQLHGDHEGGGYIDDDLILLNVLLGQDSAKPWRKFLNLDIFELAIIGSKMAEELIELFLGRGEGIWFGLWRFSFLRLYFLREGIK